MPHTHTHRGNCSHKNYSTYRQFTPETLQSVPTMPCCKKSQSIYIPAYMDTGRVKTINLAGQSIMWLGAVTKGEHVANTFAVSRGAICGQTQSLIKIHTEPVLLRWVGKMLHQDVVTTRLSTPTGMYLPYTVLPHAWVAQWQAPL